MTLLLRSAAVLLAMIALACAPDLRAQGVSVDVGPFGGVRVRTPFYSFDRAPGSPYGYRGPRPAFRPGFFGPPPGVRVQVRAGRRAIRFEQPPSALAPELSESSDQALVAGLDGAHAALDARLGQFNRGEGWQRYFALPETAGDTLAGYAQLLSRFDSVAANPEYRVIAELEEFAAMHELLRAEFGPSPDNAPDEPVNEDRAPETLPAPADERSVLSIPDV